MAPKKIPSIFFLQCDKCNGMSFSLAAGKCSDTPHSLSLICGACGNPIPVRDAIVDMKFYMNGAQPSRRVWVPENKTIH